MSNSIIIVGGGISGLTLLHHLKQKYGHRPEVSIKLLEKDPRPGGTIKTFRNNGYQYETGPNGFLDSKPTTLQLAKDLGLENELITADQATKIRYICVNDKLYALPTSPLSFLFFPPLNVFEKIRVLKEIAVAKGQNPDETVYEFGTRRLGEGFAKFFLEPMVSGIFGGDVRELNLRLAFPRIYEIEQTYGSLFKGMLDLGMKKRKQKNSLAAGQPTGQLWSFKKGMGQLTETLSQKYAEHIHAGVNVQKISPDVQGYKVTSEGMDFFADELILSVPAYVAAGLIENFDPSLSQKLKDISYASIAVVGFVYSKEQFKKVRKGFGYLRTSASGKEALGALFSSQIYGYRCPDDKLLFQVMLGGAKNPQTINRTDEELFKLASEELQKNIGVQGEPVDRFLVRWGQAIPQYNRNYPPLLSGIRHDLATHPCLYLLANYLDGISLNDCTANAKKLAETINL